MIPITRFRPSSMTRTSYRLRLVFAMKKCYSLAMKIEFRANPNAQSQISRAIIESVQKIKCPTHGTGAAVVSETPPKFQYCCQELEAKIKAEAR